MFSARDTLGTVVFTVIELVTLIVWLDLAPKAAFLSYIVLAVGLFLEHYISVLVGRKTF